MPSVHGTHSLAILAVSPMVYQEISRKLREAGYDHAFDTRQDTVTIDMTGIGVQVAVIDDPIDPSSKSWAREQDIAFEVARKYRLMAIYGERVSFTKAEAEFISEFLAPRDMREGGIPPIAREDRAALRRELPPTLPEDEDDDSVRLAKTQDAIQDDIVAILRALGLSDNARPMSAHDVVRQEILPAITALRYRRELNVDASTDQANTRQVGGSHYQTEGGLQHWDIVVIFDLDYFQGQITKYVFRWDRKNGVQDLEKAKHFLEKYIEEIKNGKIQKGASRTTPPLG